MNAEDVKKTRWSADIQPNKAVLLEMMAEEGLSPYTWSNGPGDVYSAHNHSYHKVIYVVSGSITFGLPEIGDSVYLQTGDRLDLPAGVVHDAVVGPQGVVCLEGHR
jgi:quercetin dioxygenase-like cupin family protein